MPHTDQILARATARPTAFTCTATHGGLDAAWVHVAGELDNLTAPQLERTLHEAQQLDLRELTSMDFPGLDIIFAASLSARHAGRRLVIVRGRPDIYRMFIVTGSSADVDIGDLEPVQPAATSTSSAPTCQTPTGRCRMNRSSL